MNYYAFFPFAGCVANVILGIYIINRGYREIENRIFFLFTMTVSFWSFTDVLRRVAPNADIALFWMKVGTFGSCFSTVTLLHFFFYFTNTDIGKIKRNIILVTAYSLALFFSILEYSTDLITRSAQLFYWGYKPIEGKLYFLHFIFIIGCIVLSLILNIKFFSLTQPGCDFDLRVHFKRTGSYLCEQ